MSSPRRTVSYKGLNILHNGFECYSRCRFCIIKRARINNVSLDRALAQVDRFYQWNQARGGDDFRVFISYGRGFNYDVASAEKIVQLAQRIGEDATEITLGGLEMMPDTELYNWLKARYAIGMNQIRLSMAGTQALHDRWVGREGDYAFHLRAARMAADIGYRRNEWIFVTRSTLPYLAELVKELDAIPGGHYRGFRMMNWEQYPRRAEEERLTREIFNQLPDFVLNNIQFGEELKTEQEWIDEIRSWPHECVHEFYYLNLKLDAATIGALEKGNCDDIIADLTQRSSEIYEAIPTMKTLGETYGDSTNPLMYHRGEMQRKWIIRFLADNPTFKPHRGLTWIY